MRRPSPSLAASLLVLGAAFAALTASVPRPAHPAETGPRPVPLPLDRVLERDLRPGEVHAWVFPAHAGDLLDLVVDQRGVDVVATLFDPAGRKLLAADSPTGSDGPEPVVAVAESDGPHVLEVRPWRGEASGRYAVRVEAVRPATAADRVRAGAAAAFARGEELRARGEAADLREALGAYREALAGWRRLGQDRQEAVTLRRIGQVCAARADLRPAAASFEAALLLLRKLGDEAEEARVLNDAGAAYRLLAEPRRAEEAYDRALLLARARGDRRIEALALNNLGVLHDSQGSPQKALTAYGRALDAWRELGDRSREAATLHNLGMVYGFLGRQEEALRFLEPALRFRRAAGDRRGEADTLTAVAWARELGGEKERALDLYGRALDLYRGLGDPHGEAVALGRRSAVLAQLGRRDEAAAGFERALEIFRRTGARSGEADLLTAMGWLHAARGDPGRALEDYGHAFRIFHETGDRHGEAFALLAAARAERDRGRLHPAAALAERALGMVETLRGAAPGSTLRISYLATRHEYYELAIDLRMRLAEREPGRGHDVRALETSERARARGLLDELAEAGSAAVPAGFEEIRRELAGDTLLLEYALGEERSFLWVVGGEGILTRVLPGRREIEERARRVHDLLARSERRGVQRQAELEAAALADRVVGPVAGELGAPGIQRLVIVADGALELVPFAALPVAAGGSGERVPLLARHEVVHLPSVSVLVQQRRERAGRARAPHLVAVLADPVFAPDDERLARPGATMALVRSSDLERSVRAAGLEGLPRLPHSRQEAEEILRLVPSGEGLEALGFQASRETVLSGVLSRYRIVHFATHSLINLDHPELSGVVLSLVDEHGRRRDGFLRAREIPGLHLSAELVVLSACRTALGREIRGEGLMGLTRGFLQAGAERLVVSLWGVDDEATAELMARFYRGMLREGRPASQALRAAQLSLRNEPRWQAPYYWAGFTVQGEWR